VYTYSRKNNTKNMSEKEKITYSDIHLEKAKTKRGRCKECDIAFEPGEIKISKEISSAHGKMCIGFHPTCGIHLFSCPDNRSKCQTCKEKIVQGDIRVIVGRSRKEGPSTKHHFDCVFEKGWNEGHRELVQAILLEKKESFEIKEGDGGGGGDESIKKVSGKKKKKSKKEEDDLGESDNENVKKVSGNDVVESDDENVKKAPPSKKRKSGV